MQFNRFRKFFLLTLVFLASCAANTPSLQNNAVAPAKTTRLKEFSYRIVKSYPHDPKAFTQGLQFYQGYLYEGTGGREGDDFFSTLRKVDLETGRVLKKYELPRDYFGEGITIYDNKIYQLTWQEMTAFVYDLNDFTLLREIRYPGEGWGLTSDGTDLIMSDGTHVLRFVDPESFKTKRTIVVRDESGRPLARLNELEFIKGEIWANVWETPFIVRIDPETGKLLGRIDFTDLIEQVRRNNRKADVLNGIAYDSSADRIFITGKLWDKVYEIQVQEK
ncbi:MAG: glutaminyl-peptide cyclotransferase [Acidobacteriota bacterium]|jgi:glutamine cyclotransferase